MCQKSKSTRFEFRLPIYMFEDLVKIQKLLGYSSLSNFIRYIMCGEIVKYQGALNENK